MRPEGQTQPVPSEVVQTGAGAGRPGERHPGVQRAGLQTLRPPGQEGLTAPGSHDGRLAAAEPPAAAGRWDVPLPAGARHRGRERGGLAVGGRSAVHKMGRLIVFICLKRSLNVDIQ